ncbi:MAG: hypothetical protein CVT89_06285 [Candidatus Altiarchaeales archaeon HGW-Altiarchaeales-2]|nr:MAG: hypothetical protein CVT89_06285 [Candidatus Altiarchaeales archaeon HGW-Altiarchaeales-2]
MNLNANTLNVIKVIGKKDFTETFKSFGVYIMLGIIFLISFIGLYALSEVGKGENVNILFGMSAETSALINSLFMFAVVFVSFLYIGISSVTAIAKEKQERTIELLFYAPVDEFSFIAGKFLGKISTYLLILLLSALFFILLCFAFSIQINITGILKVAVLSVFLISCVIAGGLFLSALSSNVTTSIFVLIGVTIFLTVIQIIGGVLNFLPLDPTSLTGILKDGISKILALIQYISPFSYYDIGADAIGKNDNTQLFLSMLYSVAYSLVFLMLSIIVLMKKRIK